MSGMHVTCRPPVRRATSSSRRRAISPSGRGSRTASSPRAQRSTPAARRCRSRHASTPSRRAATVTSLTARPPRCASAALPTGTPSSARRTPRRRACAPTCSATPSPAMRSRCLAPPARHAPPNPPPCCGVLGCLPVRVRFTVHVCLEGPFSRPLMNGVVVHLSCVHLHAAGAAPLVGWRG